MTWAEEEKSRKAVSFCVLLLLLCAAVLGFSGAFITAFSLQVTGSLFYGFLFISCLFWAGFSRIRAERVFRVLALLAVMVVGSFCLLLLQNAVISGFLETVNCVVERLNVTYQGNLALYQVLEDPLNVTVFLLFMVFGAAGFLSVGIMYRPNIWVLAALYFPLLAGGLLAGGEPGFVFLFLMLLALIGTAAASSLGDPFGNTGLYERILGKSILLAGILALALTIPAFFILKQPLEKLSEQVENSAMKTENGILQALWKILPEISGGRLRLMLEGTGGGVDDGNLGQSKGYYFGSAKALKLTSTKKPEETVYLKGYIGTDYTGNSFEAASETVFLNAALNWKIEDHPALYIQNLSFLRMAYAENVSFGEEEVPALSGEITAAAQELKVEKIDANDAYTYLPYYAFLNEYYEILAGDGAVKGQTLWEDIFYYYSRESYQEAMEEWLLNEHSSVLDEVEASYESFVRGTCTQVPESGLSRLKAECEAAQLTDIEEIKDYVVTALSQNYVFNRDVESLPEGKDFVDWFLYEKKEGYSTHFAAAATMMFRMFGVPARYVVGYAAPADVFSLQSDGSYVAVLEEDNAHAWTEIYVSGIGWMPVETTPGFVGLLSEETYASADGQTESTAGEKEEQENQPDETEAIRTDEIGEDVSAQTLPARTLCFIIAACVLLAVFLVLRRQFLLKKRLGKLGGKEPKEKIKCIYKGFFELLMSDGWKNGPGCADAAFAGAVSEKYRNVPQELAKNVSEIVLQAHYGYHMQGEGEVALVRNAYVRLGKAVYSRSSLKRRIWFKLWKCYL